MKGGDGLRFFGWSLLFFVVLTGFQADINTIGWQFRMGDMASLVGPGTRKRLKTLVVVSF